MTNPLILTEGGVAIPIGSYISLVDADSVNSDVTVDEVTVSVESGEEEQLVLLESDPDITVVWRVAARERGRAGRLGTG